MAPAARKPGRLLRTATRHIVFCAAIALAGMAGFSERAEAQSMADSYPNKPIKIIVPYAAGGSGDIIVRTVAQKMSETWNQSVLVENRPGGGAMIGTGIVAKAPADGYTLVMVVSTHTTNPAMHPKMAYDSIKDFQPISLLARTPVVAFVNPSFPAKNLKELVAIAKSKPGSVAFGSAGTASMTHLTAELLKMKEGIEMTHVVYRGGAPALADVLAGHVPMTFATVGQALPQYHAKQVRALGISSTKRYPSVPDIPTFIEQGFDIVVTEWYGLLAPAGVPQEIVKKLNVEIRRIIALPSLGDRLSAIELVSSTPEEMGAFIRSETDKWGPLIQKLGVKSE